MTEDETGFVETASGEVEAHPEELFDFLDNPRNLGAHMNESSWMMAGSSMRYRFDDGGGRDIGSVFGFEGSFLGLRLQVEEVVTQKTPPLSKTWKTRGTPKLLVMGAYEMGFVIQPKGGESILEVWIRYRHPPGFAGAILGRLLGGIYARWCTRSMLGDARRNFEETST